MIKENPDEFIQELSDQDTRDTLHEAIKEKLSKYDDVKKWVKREFQNQLYMYEIHWS